jgi:hypothetical protein
MGVFEHIPYRDRFQTANSEGKTSIAIAIPIARGQFSAAVDAEPRNMFHQKTILEVAGVARGISRRTPAIYWRHRG